MSSEPLSAYEQQRLANIAENAKKLEALGITAIVPRRPSLQLSRKKPTKLGKRPTLADADTPLASRRRSSRLSGDLPEPLSDAPRDQRRPLVVEKPPDVFGEIPGFPCGSGWEMRTECCADLVHRATVAGIVGSPSDGCYSIVLNGGYPDDLDFGEALTYTGSGGRSLKGTKANPKNLRTGPATKNQTLEGNEGRFNAALHKSFEAGTPVRVVRGFKLDSPWAPIGVEYGGKYNYRYDGLYKVENAWLATGLEGFKVWKFALKRLAGQPPLTTAEVENAAMEQDEGGEEGK